MEKRSVSSLPILFGDLGGLYEFFATLLVTLIGTYQAKVFVLSQVQSLFRAAKRKNLSQISGEPLPLSHRHKVFKSTKTDQCLKLKIVYWLFCRCFVSKKEKRLIKQIEVGGAKIEKALDIRTLIRN